VKKFIVFIFAILAVAICLPIADVSAQNPNGKMLVEHYTGSESNPYVVIEVGCGWLNNAPSKDDVILSGYESCIEVTPN